MTQKSVLIAGTGAVATLFAVEMASVGYFVKMLGFWPEAVQAIKNQGVRMVDEQGCSKSARVEIFNNPAEVGEVDYALVLVKSWQTSQYAKLLKQCLRDDGIALTLQNGLGNREALAEELGIERCLAGVILLGATILEPGLVKCSGEPLIQLEKDPRLDPLIEILQHSGFRLEIFDDLNSLRWGKLIINSGINPLTAVLGVLNGELADDPYCRSILADLAQEGEKTATAFGVKLPYIDAMAAMDEVISKTAKNSSSMQQDLQRGAPTEIDAINGAIVRHAHRIGLPVPVNECLLSLVKSLAMRGIRQI